MRRFSHLVVLAASALMAISCADTPTTSEAPLGSGRIGLAPSFTPSASLAYTALAAFGIEVTNVRVRLTAPDGSTRDTTIAFPVGMETLRIEMSVPLRTAGQSFRAELELRNAEGQVLFSGTQQVVAQASTVLGGSSPAIVQLQYTGPGSTAKSVTVAPANPTLVGPNTLNVTATGADAAGTAVTDLLVTWTSSDATLATVTRTGDATATVTSTGKRGSVTISAITPLSVTGTTRLNLIPVASRLVVISGSGQTGAAGSTLAQPLVVEVQAADNLPVAGAPIAFRAITAGGSVTTATAVADASGRASTTLTLGRTAGTYQFEAASGTLAPVTASETATPAPAAAIAVFAGDAQSAVVGSALPQPLTARVVDQFGAPVSGATVQWAKVSGAGSLGSATSTTGADGSATNTYTLGNVAGVESVAASLPGVTSTGGSVLFTARALAGAPANISGAGGGQSAPAGTALSKPLVVRVTDAFGNPVVNAQVFWRVSSSGPATATFAPQASTTSAFGLAETVVTFGITPGQVTIAAIVGTLSFNFQVVANASSSTDLPGVLSGFVYNAVTGAPLFGVAVSVMVAGGEQTVYTTVTASDGRYATLQVAGGIYDVRFTAQGFVTTTTVSQRINGNTVAEAVPMVPASSSPGSISGSILDATTSRSITGTATVELRVGINATTGSALQTVQTTGSGNYIFSNVSAGTYTVLARASGYADASKTGIAVGAQNTSSQNVFLSPTGAAGTVRIVLTWRADPRDLDSYLTGPIAESTNRFTIAYYSQGNCSASPFACLDQDVTSGFGPETMTITRVLPGIYRFTVNKYSGSGPLEQSGARVDVYIDGLFRQAFSVPAGSGRNWTVFELNGNQLTAINVIGDQSIASRTPLGSPVAASRTPLGPATSTPAARDDNAIINEATRRNPKGRAAPR